MSCKTHFVQQPQLSCENMHQSSIRMITYADFPDEPTTITVKVTLPPYVLPYYWTLASLSLQDIHKQSECIPARFYWVAALLYGIDASASSIKTSMSSYDQTSLAAKPTAINKILKAQKITLSEQHKLPLWNDISEPASCSTVKKEEKEEEEEKDSSSMKNTRENNKKSLDFFSFQQHRPPIPIIKLSQSDFLEAVKLVVCLEGKLLQEPPVEVRGFFLLKNRVHVLPLCFFESQNLLLLKRVVLASAYEKSGKQKPTGYASIPPIITCKGVRYAIVEDAFFGSPVKN